MDQLQTAEMLYASTTERGVENIDKTELMDICRRILEAPGDQAMTICLAHEKGWWQAEVCDPCKAIFFARGNTCEAIHCAKFFGWWDFYIAVGGTVIRTDHDLDSNRLSHAAVAVISFLVGTITGSVVILGVKLILSR